MVIPDNDWEDENGPLPMLEQINSTLSKLKNLTELDIRSTNNHVHIDDDTLVELGMNCEQLRYVNYGYVDYTRGYTDKNKEDFLLGQQ